MRLARAGGAHRSAFVSLQGCFVPNWSCRSLLCLYKYRICLRVTSGSCLGFFFCFLAILTVSDVSERLRLVLYLAQCTGASGRALPGSYAVPFCQVCNVHLLSLIGTAASHVEELTAHGQTYQIGVSEITDGC